jgi:diadenosine tetraphosphate (Ap4A) HIT family hydrolase
VSDGCTICQIYASRERHVYDDGAWFAFATGDVPGWVMLASKEHAEGTWGLSAEQAAGLGPAIRAVGRAVKQATAAQRVHTVFLGEHALHFHLGFFPRADGEPPLLDNTPLVGAAQADADPERARALEERIRAMLASETR